VLHHVRQDMSFAIRSMTRAPGFLVPVLLTLAFGIGANVAIFTGVDEVDFLALAGTCALLLLVAALATMAPVRRAMDVSPTEALRGG